MTFETFDATVASPRLLLLLWLVLLSTVAQNFLNFLCRYFESFVVLVIKVDVDEMIVGVAGAACWSFVDFCNIVSTMFVRLMVTDV